MQDKVADLIRSFGMSGFLVTEELKTLEQRYDVELGHTTRNSAEDQTDYYPQFEHSVRSEAADMSSHYELFYCLETSIRKLISETSPRLRDLTGGGVVEFLRTSLLR